MSSKCRIRKGDHRMIRCKNNRPSALLRRAVALVLAMLMLCGITVSAADMEGVPYYSYCFWEGPSRYESVPMRNMYETDIRIDGASLGTTALKNPQYITLSPDYSTLYILDSGNTADGNSRILVVDAKSYKLIRQIGEIQSADGPLNYKGATGMYVAADGTIYIADRENRRVLIADANGQLIRTLTCPQGNNLPEDLEENFFPEKVLVDNKGYLYIGSQAIYHGLMVFDTEHQFKGFHGTFKVDSNVFSTIATWWKNMTTTNAQANASQDKNPPGPTDISIDKEGMLYALTSGNYGQIKRMGLTGTQTLNHKFGFTTQNGDLINFREPSYWVIKEQMVVSLASFTVGPDGFIYLLDKSRGRITMYDEECRSICTFSGGLSLLTGDLDYTNAAGGQQVGTFTTPQSIACGEDKLYVMDFANGSVTVFNRTEYGKLFKQANALTIDGEYAQALPLWREVLRLDANNQRAYEGIAKALLRQADAAMDAADLIEDKATRAEAVDAAKALYRETMEYAELGNDQQTYSQAYTVIQKDWLSNNFWWLFIVCLAAVGGIAALLVMSKKRKIFEIKNVKVKTALSVPLHPIVSFNSLKYQKTGSVPLACLFVVLLYLATVSQDLFGGFMYVITDTTSYNSLFTLIGSVGILLLWVIVNWGICILNDGKGTLKEVFTMSCYSMSPLIVYSVVYVVASHLIPATSTSTFGLLSTIVFIYTALLLLLGMTVVHEYTFFKAMAMTVLVILCMLLAAFVIFAVVLLSQQFINFFVDLVNEIMLR